MSRTKKNRQNANLLTAHCHECGQMCALDFGLHSHYVTSTEVVNVKPTDNHQYCIDRNALGVLCISEAVSHREEIAENDLWSDVER